MISGKARAVAVLVHAAPVVLGLPLYVAIFSLGGGMLVFFFPGVFMVVAGLLVALIVRQFSPPGFVRTEAAGSLRFHGIVALAALVVLVLVFTALFAGGNMGAAGSGAMLLGVLLPLLELARAVMYGIGAARAPQAPPLPGS
ncbi:MAG: hypothetical protein JWM87_1014 [Candidatus Eremiobacteraeota bacterium]|nr:hypothetical protein [Candidatus Eremiobacteraeota bacterium]